MARVVAVMNTKGGVGKSTTAMMLAEALASEKDKHILLIDADSQSSISNMIISTDEYIQLEKKQKTLFEYMINSIQDGKGGDISGYLKHVTSDVTGAQSISLFPSRIELSILEREVMLAPIEFMQAIRDRVRDLIEQAKTIKVNGETFDLILIDCPPGISVMTEALLLESDFYLAPVKPDYLSVRGLQVLQTLKKHIEQKGNTFPTNIGTLTTMMTAAKTAKHYASLVQSENSYKAFTIAIPHSIRAAEAAQPSPNFRGFRNKYPGALGSAIIRVADEFWTRLN